MYFSRKTAFFTVFMIFIVNVGTLICLPVTCAPSIIKRMHEESYYYLSRLFKKNDFRVILVRLYT